MAAYPEAALNAATGVLERWLPSMPYAREAARRILDEIVPLLSAPEHGVAIWASPREPGFYRALCLCGRDFLNLHVTGADAALQLHITDKLAGHREGVVRHTVSSWALLRLDDGRWQAACQCSVKPIGASPEAANAALRLHFEEVNARG